MLHFLFSSFKFLLYIFNLHIYFCHFDSIVIMSVSFGGKVSSPVVVTSDSSLCRAFSSNFLLCMMQKACSFLDLELTSLLVSKPSTGPLRKRIWVLFKEIQCRTCFLVWVTSRILDKYITHVLNSIIGKDRWFWSKLD